MKNIPEQEALKRFQILSDSLQNIIFSEKTAASINKAAILGGIEGRVTDLAKMTGYVLLGFLNPLTLKEEIKNEFGISDETAEQVYSLLDAEIFSLVDSELRKLYPPRIKTPTVTSFGFSNNQIQEKENKESVFEKRFFKKQPVYLNKKETDQTKQKPFKAQIPNAFIKKEESTSTHQINQITEKKDNIHQNPLNQNIKKTETTEKKEDIKPVVPLPTFMQSQFQPIKKTDNIYKEPLPKEEGKNKKQEIKTPKVNGNVIDLRDL